MPKYGWLLAEVFFIMAIPYVATLQGAENKARPQAPFIFPGDRF
jgi:hypothetical protein